MSVTATLNNHNATDARADIRAWGCWYADISIDGAITLTGRVTLKIADLALYGTVLSGGAANGRSHFRIVAGAGGWGKTIEKKSYTNDLGVKLATVLRDAASAAGETLDMSTVPATTVGPAFARKAGAAGKVLDYFAPQNWYVGEDGVTRIGKRAAGRLPAGAIKSPPDLARRTMTIASESIASILPGLVVDGLTAVDVLHEVSPKGLRSTIWGALGAATGNRSLDAFRVLLDRLDPDRAFRGVTEYRVVTQAGERLNLQPVRASTGMPDLRGVKVSPGLAGAKSTLTPGARVLVTFVDASPTRPLVVGFEDAEGGGFLPLQTAIDATTLVKLGAGVKPVIAAGDLAGGIWPCAPTQVKVTV